LLVLSPLARALVAAGHTVAFAAPSEFAPDVAAAGFTVLPAGPSLAALRRAALAELPGATPDRLALRMFTTHQPRALWPELIGPAGEWKPDLIVHEEGEYGGPLVAALLNVPSVVMGWPAPLRPPAVLRRVDAALIPTWIQAGLAPAPLGDVYRHLFLDTCPPSMQAPHAQAIASRLPLRPLLDASVDQPPPALPPSPIVHLSFGTVLALDGALLELARSTIDGLRGRPISIVATVGAATDPTSLGSPHPRLVVRSFIPHAALLPGCDAVVCHGGAGTTIAALSHGLPLLLTPAGGASQHRLAGTCARLGAARVLDRAAATPEQIRAHLESLLSDPGYRAAAQAVAEEVRALPGADAAIEAMSKLAGSDRDRHRAVSSASPRADRSSQAAPRRPPAAPAAPDERAPARDEPRSPGH
jgi:UDP:flavonoid glycosyltransferase YjiC (YdhE family)